MHKPRKDQFTGCLIGQCLGDALGFPVEGRSQPRCKRYVDEVLREDRVAEQRRGPYRFGQYSDDSQLARELLLSYTKKGIFDPIDYAQRIAALFTQNRIVGRGRATEQATFRLHQGIAWDQAGTPAPEAGNGSAMRAGPVGLLCWNDPQELIQVTYDQGRITHQDPRCGAGAVAIAGAVALVLQADELDIQSLLHQLALWTRPLDPILAEALISMQRWVDLSPEEAFEEVAPIGLGQEYLPPPAVITPFVTTSVLWSMYAFLHQPGDYLEAISTAISVGGDVDTTAAMTGAISGAWLGLGGIPAGWSEHLNDQGSWGLEELERLAEKTYRMSVNAARGG
jgi:ADP-ribosylglycohydrolase